MFTELYNLYLDIQEGLGIKNESLQMGIGYELWHTDSTDRNKIMGQLLWRQLRMKHLSW